MLTTNKEDKAQNIIEAVGKAGQSSPAAFWVILALVLTTCVIGYLLHYSMSKSQERHNRTADILTEILMDHRDQNKAIVEAFKQDRPGQIAEADRAQFIAALTAMQQAISAIRDNMAQEQKQDARQERLLQQLLDEMRRQRGEAPLPQGQWYDRKRWAA